MDLPLFSSSEEYAFKQCRLAHHFRYDLGYTPVITDRKLAVGTGVHIALEVRYRGGDLDAQLAAVETWTEERWAELEAAGRVEDNEYRLLWIKDRDLVKHMVIGYDRWVSEEGIDDGYETVAVEEKWYIEVPGAPCVMPVKLDLLQRHTESGRLRIVDFKTRDKFYTDTTSYVMAEQNGNYQLAVFAMFGERPTELAYRELRKMTPETNPRSSPPYFREVLVPLTAEEMVKRAEDYVATALDRFDPERRIYPNPASCCGSWKADYRAPCQAVRMGEDPATALELNPGFTQTDSYARYLEESD